MLLEFLGEGEGLVAVDAGICGFLLSFLGGVEADKFGAHACGVGFAAEPGVSVAESEIYLRLFGKGPLRNLQMRKGFRGTVGVDAEQANQVMSERKLRTELESLLRVLNTVGRICAVEDGGDLQKRAYMPRIVL